MDSPKLRPYPNWDSHRFPKDPQGTPPTIVSPFRIRADSCKRLWVMDTGIDNVLKHETPITPPQLLIFDLTDDRLIRRYQIPKSQRNSQSFLANIAVEDQNCEDTHAYLADLFDFGLIVYSWRENRSWRIKHNYFHPDPLAGEFNVSGLEFHWNSGLFGIALSPIDKDGYSTLYFHPCVSNNEFAVSTHVLRNETLSKNSYHSFKLLGSRGEDGQSGSSFLHKKSQVLFYSLLNRNAIGCWQTNSPIESQISLYHNDSTMVFPNDIKVDYSDNLWVLTDRLPIFLYSKFNTSEINFRILKAPVAEIIKNTACEMDKIV